MPLRLIPREEKFYEFFEAQAAKAVEAAQLFHELAEHWPERSHELLKRLQDVEHEADITTHEIYDKLNRTFVTPFDREDIHELACAMDDIVDLIQSMAARMPLYRVSRTDGNLSTLCDILLEAAQTVRKAILEFKDPRRHRRLLDHLIEINRLENAGDRALEKALGELFGGTPDPLQVIKWKEIYEGAERAIDKCEDVANILEAILVKNA